MELAIAVKMNFDRVYIFQVDRELPAPWGTLDQSRYTTHKVSIESLALIQDESSAIELYRDREMDQLRHTTSRPMGPIQAFSSHPTA